MKRYYAVTVFVSLLTLLAFTFVYRLWDDPAEKTVLKVGFIYENDEITPYTYNFTLAQKALEQAYPGQVEILTRSNVQDDQTEEPLRELVRLGCGVIFSNSYSPQIRALAPEYPEVQFCQVSFSAAAGLEYPANYHTFNGEIYQGRYVTGVAAGMQLRALIDSGKITAKEALVGYVGAFHTPEVISGYTAFLLGVRSVAPEAVMHVRYTGTWSSYTLERASARALIDAGCVIIAQHTDTIGPAVACEEAAAQRPVYHVGYNQSMLDMAPNASLVSTRVNWTPYVVGAVGAVLEQKPIESAVSGRVHGNDICAGLDLGWVEILELNKAIAAEGTAEQIERAIEGLRRGTLQVFDGDYSGSNPNNRRDTYDLNNGYRENGEFSYPTFHYVLRNVIIIDR